jgi:hypothetical protein
VKVIGKNILAHSTQIQFRLGMSFGTNMDKNDSVNDCYFQFNCLNQMQQLQNASIWYETTSAVNQIRRIMLKKTAADIYLKVRLV